MNQIKIEAGGEKIRKSYIIALKKQTWAKACYFCECINNSYIAKTVLPKPIPKALKMTLILDEDFDGAYELKLTSLTNNFAVFSSAEISGLYINKDVLPNTVPKVMGVKLDLETQ
jgi:hypothetical protein